MPPEKKTGKKHAGPHKPGHDDTKNIRRAYEHLGRVESLRRVLPESAADPVHVLAAFARDELSSGRYGNAADSLRASEHISFAALATEDNGAAPISKALLKAVDEDLDRLAAKATKGSPVKGEKRHAPSPEKKADKKLDKAGAPRPELPTELVAILEQCLQHAVEARGRGELRRALELVRAAEALAHIRQAGAPALPGAKKRQLPAQG
jgi:hypothetical protein